MQLYLLNQSVAMKEILELRVDSLYAYILWGFNGGVKLGPVRKVLIDTSTPLYNRVRTLNNILRKLGLILFYGWEYNREYTNAELREAQYFQILPKLFTLSGEECGTKYDESTACPICGSGAKMTTPLTIHKSRIPKTDISMTLGHGEEILVSERFRQVMEDNDIKGIRYAPVFSGKRQIEYFQLLPEHYFDISPKTKFGVKPFDYSEGEKEGHYSEGYNAEGKLEKEWWPPAVYKCPNGDNLGLNILSEAYIKNDPLLEGLDYFASRQTVGHKGEGLIRPRHLIFCSNRMMRIIKENNLKGFKFEVAHIVDE